MFKFNAQSIPKIFPQHHTTLNVHKYPRPYTIHTRNYGVKNQRIQPINNDKQKVIKHSSLYPLTRLHPLSQSHKWFNKSSSYTHLLHCKDQLLSGRKNNIRTEQPKSLITTTTTATTLTTALISLVSQFYQIFDWNNETEQLQAITDRTPITSFPNSSTLFHPTTTLRSTSSSSSLLPPTSQLTEFEYRTLLPSSIPAEPTLIKEKGSKFITFCHSIENDDDLKNALNEIKSLHPRATHHCYAYRMGPRGEESRANDDGEPSGSAGLPILGQINSFDISNVLITVVRYYGGTKLGVSGLIKAYKDGAKSILDECEIIVQELECGVEIGFDRYEDQNLIFTTLTRHNAEIVSFESLDDMEFDDTIDLDLQLAGKKQYTVTTRVKLKQKAELLGVLNDFDGTSVKVL